MAGDTENSDILAGVNQIIQAVNDLVLTCTPTVTVNNSNSCGCGGGTDSPASEPGQQGGTPPDDFSDPPDLPPTQGFFDRKCKVANITIDDLVTLVDKLDTMNVPELLTFGIAFLTTAIAAAFAFLPASPLIITIGIIGSAISLALIFFSSAVDLLDLSLTITNNRQALVCTLYGAVDSQIGQDDFIAELDNLGASSIQQSLVEGILTVKALSSLFFVFDGVGGADIETRLDGYTPPTDCSTCCNDIFIEFGTYDQPTDTYTSTQAGAQNIHHVAVYVNAESTTNFCGGHEAYNIQNLVGQVDSEHPGADFAILDDADLYLYGNESGPKNGPWPDGTCGRRFVIRSHSTAQFTVQLIKDVGGCP